MWTSVITAPEMREGILGSNFLCARIEIKTCKNNCPAKCKQVWDICHTNMHSYANKDF